MRHTYKTIFNNYKLLGPIFRRWLLIGIFGQATELLSPYFASKIVYAIETSKNMTDVRYRARRAAGAMLLFVIGNRVFYCVTSYVSHTLWAKKQAEVKEQILALSYEQVIDTGSGKVIAKVTQGTQAEKSIFVSLGFLLVHVGFKTTALLFLLGRQEPLLVGLFMCFALVTLRVNTILAKKLAPIEDRVQEIIEKNNTSLVRIVTEYLLVKLGNTTRHEIKQSNEDTKEYGKLGVYEEIYGYVFRELLHIIVKGLELGVYIRIGAMVITTQTSFSYITLLIGYLRTLRRPLSILLEQTAQINRQMPYYHNLKKFLNQPKTITDGWQHFAYRAGEIKVENVCFGYQKAEDEKKKTEKEKDVTCHCEERSDTIFSSFSHTFPAGRTTAIVGHSGSGKSTLIKLLLRLYDVQSGNIRYDGQDVKNIRIATLYDHIGYLSQEPAIFDGTIRENLMYGIKQKKTEEIGRNEKKQKEVGVGVDLLRQLRDALAKADADGFVHNLEKGLDTEIGERGVKLSGGEKQRIAIARIFLKDPKVLILDEPTASLDSIAEAKITKVLQSMMQGRTVIVIAHRLQTVQHADHILVLEQGKIIEQGTHTELLGKNGTYATLVDLQHGVVRE